MIKTYLQIESKQRFVNQLGLVLHEKRELSPFRESLSSMPSFEILVEYTWPTSQSALQKCLNITLCAVCVGDSFVLNINRLCLLVALEHLFVSYTAQVFRNAMHKFCSQLDLWAERDEHPELMGVCVDIYLRM